MSLNLRAGLLYVAESELNQSVKEQVLGARLAADYTRERWPTAELDLELIEHRVTDDPASVDEAARELVNKAGCQMLLGALTVPLSIRAAQWAEAEGKLYVAANNNPLVRESRRFVFGIGVPSEITAEAGAKYLLEKRKSSRVCILHTNRDFQIHAAACMVSAMKDKNIAVEDIEIGEDPVEDAQLLNRVRDWKADAICIQGSETERLAELVKAAHSMGGLPSMLHPRGLLCSEFASLTGKASGGHDFTDLYFRNSQAPEEEKALHRYLEAAVPGLVATASHGFGWDCLRLVAEAGRSAGPKSLEQVSYLESLSRYSGATGMLSFTKLDHNGRWWHDPTTIARLSGGRFRVIDTLSR